MVDAGCRGVSNPAGSRVGRDVEVAVLGPFEVRVVGRAVPMTSPKHRVLLASLALRAGEVVSIGELAEAIWDGRQPGNPRRAVQLYVTRLRDLLARPDQPHVIATAADGYRMDMDARAVDLGQFRCWVQQADHAARDDDPDREAAALTQALGLFRGRPLADVSSDLLQREIAPRLTEELLRVTERRIEVDLRRGRHEELVGDLVALTGQHPLRERLWVYLLTALHASGRRGEALDAYHRARHHLAGELGIEPGAELQAVHARVLTGRPADGHDPGTDVLLVPRQLPPDLVSFTGRCDDLARLDALAPDPGASAASVRVAVIAGTAGVGKTALAVHWARRVADRFPDGQLWVDLRGFGPEPAITPTQALTRILRSLGVRDGEIPSELEDQRGLYRSLLDGRRMLVILDNARSPEQVRPLLPGAPGCLVIVTSRSQLSGLAATESAQPVVLDLLNLHEAREFLARRLGAARVSAEPAATDEIIRLCARLPLALAIVTARGAAHPDFDLQTLAAGLRDRAGSLDAFTGVDTATEVRAVLSWSYRALTPPASDLFRLLSLHPGPDVTASAAASLTAQPPQTAHSLLTELTHANLITEHVPGRYSFHDLLRAYAGELCATQDTPAARREARHRMLDHYLLTAAQAATTLQPWEPVDPDPAQPGVTIDAIGDHHQALHWFATEHSVLLAVLAHAADVGYPAHTRRLAWAMTEYLCRQGRWHDWARALQTALDTTGPDDGLDQARCHRELTWAYARLGQPDAAEIHGTRALRLAEKRNDTRGLAIGHRAMGVLREVQGRHDQALDHDLEALALFQSLSHRSGEARALNSVGWTYTQLGDHHRAIDYCARALPLLEALDDRQAQAATWDSLGYAHHHLAQHAKAIACYRQALDLFRDTGNRSKQAEILTHLGDTHRDAGDPAAARRAWQAAEQILLALGLQGTKAFRTRVEELAPDEQP